MQGLVAPSVENVEKPIQVKHINWQPLDRYPIYDVSGGLVPNHTIFDSESVSKSESEESESEESESEESESEESESEESESEESESDFKNSDVLDEESDEESDKDDSLEMIKLVINSYNESLIPMNRDVKNMLYFIAGIYVGHFATVLLRD